MTKDSCSRYAISSGTVTDWWFEPADGWKPGPMNPEKERMKEMCAPVYEWVKTMK